MARALREILRGASKEPHLGWCIEEEPEGFLAKVFAAVDDLESALKETP